MKYSQKFLTLKGYSATSMFLGQPGICQFTSPNIRIIPDRFPWCLPGGNTIPRSHPRKFLKIFHFPRWVKQSQPGYWSRVYRVVLQWLNVCVKNNSTSLGHMEIFTINANKNDWNPTQINTSLFTYVS